MSSLDKLYREDKKKKEKGLNFNNWERDSIREKNERSRNYPRDLQESENSTIFSFNRSSGNLFEVENFFVDSVGSKLPFK